MVLDKDPENAPLVDPVLKPLFLDPKQKERGAKGWVKCSDDEPNCSIKQPAPTELESGLFDTGEKDEKQGGR